MSESSTVKSWREIYQVHPCADVFPMLSDVQIDELAADITAHGLRSQIALWCDNDQVFVLDGRNRLEALTRLGVEFRFGAKSRPAGGGDAVFPDGRATWVFRMIPADQDPAAYVISANILRRQLTKEAQAELIVKAIEAGKIDRAETARSFNTKAGQKGGSTKDAVLAAAVAEGAKHGISKRTIQNARATVLGRIPARSPEAIGQRLDRMRTMAGEGYSSRQIADVVKVSADTCRRLMREAGIAVPADAEVGGQRHHNSSRILKAMIMDAENLTADVKLVDFGSIDSALLADSRAAAIAAKGQLAAFIRRVEKEQTRREADREVQQRATA